MNETFGKPTYLSTIPVTWREDYYYHKDQVVCQLVDNKLYLVSSKKNLNQGNEVFDSETGDLNTQWWNLLSLPQVVTTGIILPFAGTVAPVGFLFTDGSAISREYYSDLFSVIGTAYGAGDGSTTFNIPNTINRVLWGGSRGFLEAGLPQHTHENAHYHQRGTMEITANGIGVNGRGGPAPSGAVYVNGTGAESYDGDAYTVNNLAFSASRSWTGGTSLPSSTQDTYTAKPNTGNADNSVYGASDTVQPPSCKCFYIIKY